MRKHSKLILASLMATLMALVVSGVASARVFSISNRNFRIVWTSLQITNNFAIHPTRCRVTLEGSFHSQTISKVEKALIGYISRASVAGANCVEGSATIHQESLPWHITYNGFTGFLPEILTIGILMTGMRFQIRTFFSPICTATVDATHPVRGEILVGVTEASNLTLFSGRIPTTGCERVEIRDVTGRKRKL
jgi:hypothetical protein